MRQPPALAAQLDVVAPDEQPRRLRSVLEHLVRRVVHERLGAVALDVDVVDAEQVMLPDDRGDRLGDPGRERVAPADGIGVAVLGPHVVGQHRAQAGEVEPVDRGRVAVQHVGDVAAVLQGADREFRAERRGGPSQPTFIQMLLVCVNSSSEASPRLRPWPDCLTPPYGDRRVHHLVRVDPDGPGAQRARRAVGARQIAGPHAGGQPVLDVVGDPVGLVLGGELEHPHHRTEDLLLSDRHLVAHPREDGRLVEVAAVAVAGASEDELGALVAPDRDIALDALELLGRHDRAHLRVGIEPAGDAHPARALDDRLHDLVIDRLVHEDARAAGADLARTRPTRRPSPRREAASRSASGKMIDGLLPPSSRLTRFTRAAAAAWIARPVWSEPVNVIASTLGVGDQRRADGLADALDDVEHARRDARLERQLGDHDRGHRRLLGRLEDDAVAGAEGERGHRGRRRRPVPGLIAPTTPSGSRTW